MTSNPTVPIVVPRVEQAPDWQTDHNAVGLADFLLTSLLRHDAGLLHADFSAGGDWRVRTPPTGAAARDEVVVTMPQGSEFRIVLARFGHQYMHDQPYGGFAEGRLTQDGRGEHLFAMYMANDPWRGFWMRTYVKRL